MKCRYAHALTAPSKGDHFIHDAWPGNSLMDLRHNVFKKTEAENCGTPLPDSVPLARFFSLARKLGVQTIVVDTPKRSADIEEENEDLAIYGRFCLRHVTRRIVALKKKVTKVADLARVESEDVLGVAIWKEDFGNRTDTGKEEVCRRVFESVVRRNEEAHSYARKEPTHRIPWGFGKTLLIKGHLFCQQNCMTNVCGHAALRTLFNACGIEWSYRRINKEAGVNHVKRKLLVHEPKGLTDKEILKVLKKVKLHPRLARYHSGKETAAERQAELNDRPWQDRVYAGAESGYPALMVFGSGVEYFSHIVPVFGHTMNRDMWIPRAERAYHYTGEMPANRFTGFQPSHLWLSAFVVHDDGLGQNYCLPKYYLPPMQQVLDGAATKGLELREVKNGVAWVVSVRPKGVGVDGADVQRGAMSFLYRLTDQLLDGGKWESLTVDAHDYGELVLRPLLISAGEWIEHMKINKDWTTGKPGKPRKVSAEILALLPNKNDLIWMVEFSIPELFPANLRKVGELIIRADFTLPAEEKQKNKARERRAERALRCLRPEDPACGLIFARLPERFLIPTGTKTFKGERGETTERFRCREVRAPFDSHTALFGAENPGTGAEK